MALDKKIGEQWIFLPFTDNWVKFGKTSPVPRFSISSIGIRGHPVRMSFSREWKEYRGRRVESDGILWSVSDCNVRYWFAILSNILFVRVEHPIRESAFRLFKYRAERPSSVSSVIR
jgi:hypothetical protein